MSSQSNSMYVSRNIKHGLRLGYRKISTAGDIVNTLKTRYLCVTYVTLKWG